MSDLEQRVKKLEETVAHLAYCLGEGDKPVTQPPKITKYAQVNLLEEMFDDMGILYPCDMGEILDALEGLGFHHSSNTEPQQEQQRLVPSISKLPWRAGPLDRSWKEFIEECNSLSPDKDKYQAYSIVTEDNEEIVCLFGPGPKARNNAEFIIKSIASPAVKVPSVDKVKLFHIFEELIDVHIKAYQEGKIIEGCYIDQPIDKATDAVNQLMRSQNG